MNPKSFICIPKKMVFLTLILFTLCILIFFSFYTLNANPTISNRAATRKIESTNPNGAFVQSKIYPYMAAILYTLQISEVQNINTTSNSYDYTSQLRCGGTFLDNNIVITTAQCVDNIAIENLFVFSGSNSLAGIAIKGQPNKLRKIIKIIPHPQFNLKTYENNIAILQLSDRNEVSDTIIYPKIPTENTYYQPGTTLRALGWGYIHNNSYKSSLLRYVDLPVIEKEKANQNTWLHGLILDTMFAAGYAENDVCTYDFGGPLLYVKNDVPLLVGIISHGEYINNLDTPCAVVHKPSIHIKTYNYRAWITSTIAQLFSSSSVNDKLIK